MESARPPWEYERVAHLVRDRILAGHYSPGDRLPTVRALSLLHSVDRNMCYRALKVLQKEGWVISRTGAGYFVAKGTRTDRVQHLRDDIAEIVADFVPVTEAHRVIADLDELVKMIRQPGAE